MADGKITVDVLNMDAAKNLRDEVERLREENAAWRKQCDTLTHQVICCGVAASHPDATLTTRGAYAGAQAEEVRKLRAALKAAEDDAALWEERARHLGWSQAPNVQGNAQATAAQEVKDERT
jgi:protein involved in temperature-dependent protein secretion